MLRAGKQRYVASAFRRTRSGPASASAEASADRKAGHHVPAVLTLFVVMLAIATGARMATRNLAAGETFMVPQRDATVLVGQKTGTP
jgi:hypothetical protein